MPARPEPIVPGQRPATPPDPLAEVLRAIDLRGAVWFDVDAAAPWVAAAPPAMQIAECVHSGTQHAIEFHVVVAGECWAAVRGEAPVRMQQGDVVVFPQGDAHVLASDPQLHEEHDLEFFRSLRTANLPVALHVGTGDAPSARLVCGFFACELRPFNPLIAALPRMLHDRAADGGDREYIRTFVERAVIESQEPAPGSGCVLTRLSELMFIDVVRRHLHSLDGDHHGWLGALRDPIVGRALAQLHARPGKAWSLDELAAASSASRTVLAERFRERVGIAPMQYLTQWRMQLACRHLERDGQSLAQIATEVGYESEAAFQRAFKKIVGTAPGTWRKQRRSR